ncbi:MAG TPA: DNA polymerase III subunit delta [Aeromicrobium sp.]|nr:DNA polymerase III subunit delta [Aeromicrobium sp.]
MTVFGKVLLVCAAGDTAEFLAERTRARALAAVLEEVPGCEVTTASAGQLTPGEFVTLTSPSLFSSATAVVLTDLRDLPEGPQAELLEYAAAPTPEVAVILMHPGGPKGKKLVDALAARSSVTQVKLEAPKYERDFTRWVREEAGRVGVSMDEAAATLLVQAVGQDLRSLAAAVDQLATTTVNGGSLTVDDVRQYFGGRADVKGYEIADAAIDGRLDLALERVRWAETARVAAPIITSALAAALRTLAKLADAPRGMADAELARHIGAPPFKLRALRQQLRAWDSAALAVALGAAASADLAIKSGEADPAYAVERLVLDISRARRATAR